MPIIESSGNSDIDGILYGHEYSTSNLTYSFPTSGDNYFVDFYEAVTGFQAFNADQEAAVRRIFDNVSSFIGLTFTLSTNAITALKFGIATSVDYSSEAGWNTENITTAQANPPDQSGDNPEVSVNAIGHAWFSTGFDTDPEPGEFDYTAWTMHEIGHLLGLAHGHQAHTIYHGDHTHTKAVLPANHDSQEYSVMTYRRYVGGPTTGGGTAEYPQTFMQNDIAALQYMYGPNFNHNNGVTEYIWQSGTGELIVNFVGQGVPGNGKIFQTVWDGGGLDTYFFTSFTTNLSIDLRPGEWINLDVGGNFRRAWLGNDDGTHHWARGHIANALLYQGDQRSLIERAFGGSGNDTFIGNAANNLLSGRSGHDTLEGGAGLDTLQGGDGNDLFKLHDATPFFFNGIYIGYDYDIVQDAGPGGLDTIYVSQVQVTATDLTHFYQLAAGVEQGAFIGFGDFELAGNELDNLIYGSEFDGTLSGAEGADTLNGGDGDDLLRGDAGNDVLEGWNHNDTIEGGEDNDVIYDQGGHDSVDGGTGNDTLYTSLGNDFLDGGDDRDTIVLHKAMLLDWQASAYDPTIALDGWVNWEVIQGSNGNDTIRGDDWNFGVEFRGGAGHDIIQTSQLAADDTLFGEHGNDTMRGGGGNDIVNGGANNDLLNGGSGRDRMIGAGGRDRFDFNSIGQAGSGAARDIIRDFDAGTAASFVDRIDLSNIDASTLAANDQSFSYIGSAAFTAGVAAQIRATQNGGRTILHGNVDGDVAAEFQIMISNAINLNNLGQGDFIA